MNIDFTGKVVMITGATGGVGIALAKAFADSGAKLALVGRRENMKELFASVLPSSAEYLSLQADLSREEEIEMVVGKTISCFERIDVLINGVGINIRKHLAEYSSEDWDRIIGVNLRAAFLLSNRVAHFMKENRYGRIVNISSMQSAICWGGSGEFSPAPYCASKAGLNALTRSFALELAPYGITVNAVCPAVIDGKWAESLKSNKAIYDDIIRRTPMKRLCRHDDIIGPVMLFSSDDGSYITGQCLFVDGGWMIE